MTSKHPDNPATYGLPPVLRLVRKGDGTLCVGVPEFVARWYVRHQAISGMYPQRWDQREKRWRRLTDTEQRKWSESLLDVEIQEDHESEHHRVEKTRPDAQ